VFDRIRARDAPAVPGFVAPRHARIADPPDVTRPAVQGKLADSGRGDASN